VNAKVTKNGVSTVKQLTARFFLVSGLIISMLIAVNTVAQESGTAKEISKCFKAADASKLAAHFNTSLDLTLPGNEGAYSKKQGEQIVKMFFVNNPVDDFTIDHTGNSNNGSTYLIGSYKSTSQKKFRVYLLIKNKNNIDLIQQLQIEQE